MNKRLLLAASALLFVAGQITAANAQSGSYLVTFEGSWTTSVTPGGVPAGSNVRAILLQGVPSSVTAATSFEISVTASHPRVTLVSMIAPSPDWFIGVSGLSLRNGGSWLASRTVYLYPYDAALRGLTLHSIADDPDAAAALALTPDFAADTTRYAAAVPHSTTHVTLTLAVNDSKAALKAGPRGALAATVSGEPGAAAALEVGENVFEIEVTAEDGSTTRTYTVTVTREAAPVPLDAAAAREHLFPLFVDGGGFRSQLFLTDAWSADNRCTLELRGGGLAAAILEEHAAVTVSDAGIEIAFGESDDSLVLTTAGAPDLAFGYAKLSCENPAVAHALLVQESGGAPAAIANLESVRAAYVFQFPVLPRSARLGLALANDNALEAACAAEVAAVSLPYAGAAFTVASPVVPGFAAAPE